MVAKDVKRTKKMLWKLLLEQQASVLKYPQSAI